MLEVLIDKNSLAACYNNYAYLKSIIEVANENNKDMVINIVGLNQDVLFSHDVKVNYIDEEINQVLKDKIKNRKSDHLLLVLSMSNYSLDVNKNNNSHYIYIDSFLTDSISKKILSHLDIKYKGLNMNKDIDSVDISDTSKWLSRKGA